MAYQTLCHRFSMAGTYAAAVTTGIAGCFLTDSADPVSTGINIGVFGWVIGALTETYTQIALYKNRVGVSRGSPIVQCAGLTGYALALAGALSVNAIPEKDPHEEFPSPPEKTVPAPKAPPVVVSAPKLS